MTRSRRREYGAPRMGLPRERLLTFFLVPGVIAAVLVLAGVMFRSSFQLEQLRERSVVEATLLLANEKADRLDKRIVEQDNAVASLVDLEELEGFGQEWLDVAPFQTPTVRSVLVMDLSSPAREVLAYASRAPGPEDDDFRRLLVHRIFAELKLGGPTPDELRHLHTTYGDASYLISHWQQQRSGRRLLLIAWHDVPRIVHELFPQLYVHDEQASRVNVVDGEGRIVYGPPLRRSGLTLGREFATTLYKWRLNVSMVGSEELAAAVQRRRVLEMVLVGLSGLVVIAGIIVITLAAARERKLANLKSEFVANVSHELKTPLALVRMFGELLQSGRVGEPEKQRQYLQIIVSESERLTALIENVLDFARVERGRAAYRFQEASLVDVVQRAAEACRVRAERQQVALEVEAPDEVPLAWIDERAIEAGVINLVDNALKYAANSPVVRLQVRRRGDYLHVAVIDQGPGVAEEERKRIFGRFERGAQATRGTVRGSGIGLALVSHIAEAHGGEAWVETAPGGGCCFLFSVHWRRRRRSRSSPGV